MGFTEISDSTTRRSKTGSNRVAMGVGHWMMLLEEYHALPHKGETEK
jgi:hypothetical protein